MPAQKYHCDYCNKQFYDTKKSREPHLQGMSHLRAKKQWFDSFRDEEDVKKQPCSFFLRTGRCQYGFECKFEHPACLPACLSIHPACLLPACLSIHDLWTDVGIKLMQKGR